jgi:hypothetical protein
MSVFISYSSVDREIANDLAELLQSLDIEYFLDRKDIAWGDPVTEAVQAGLRNCSCLVVIVSPASLKSQWVPFEVGQAVAAGKRILPYLTHPSLDVPSYLADLHYATHMDAVRTYFAGLGEAGETSRENRHDGPGPERQVRQPSQRDFLLVGCGVGNRVALLPVGPDSKNDQGLVEFLEAVNNIGLTHHKLVQAIVEARDALSVSPSKEFTAEELRRVVERYFDAMKRLPDVVRAHASPESYRWFKFGELLYEVVLDLVLDLESKSQSSAAVITAFESHVATMTLSRVLEAKAIDFIRMVRDGSDGDAVMETANRLALAAHMAL